MSYVLSKDAEDTLTKLRDMFGADNNSDVLRNVIALSYVIKKYTNAEKNGYIIIEGTRIDLRK